MVINFDKDLDPNIESIKTSNIEFEMINVVTTGSMGWSIDRDNNILTFLGTTDIKISFSSLDSLHIYSTQMELATSNPYNPYVSGLAEDPHYDKIPTGKIMNHTYEDTNVEQDLINGDA